VFQIYKRRRIFLPYARPAARPAEDLTQVGCGSAPYAPGNSPTFSSEEDFFLTVPSLLVC